MKYNIEDVLDEKSKIWETSKGKLAVTCVAMDNEEQTIVGYRTFTDIFNITGRQSNFPNKRGVQTSTARFCKNV